jgi:phosphoserine phosphatase
MRQSNLALASQPLEHSATGIPEDLLRSFDLMEARTAHPLSEKRIAVFDLDNTLLVGDIGDAVFARLRIQGYIPKLSWSEYRDLYNKDKTEAFKKVVTAMKGIPERIVARATRDVLSGKFNFIELDRALVPAPYPHPVLQRFVNHLHSSGYQIYVISASNDISAGIAATTWFAIPPSNVFGIQARIENGVLTDDLIEPLPIDRGKTDVYKKFIGKIPPLISGGDSHLDVPLLQMTDPRGFSIWVGEERIGFQVVQAKIGKPHMFYFLQRPAQLKFNEEGLDD